MYSIDDADPAIKPPSDRDVRHGPVRPTDGFAMQQCFWSLLSSEMVFAISVA